MDGRLQSYLDGEISLESLPPELREEAAGWDRLVEEMRSGTPAGAPLGFEQRVMSALSRAELRGRPRWLDWLLSPRLVPVRPVAAVAFAVALVAVALFVGLPGGDPVDSRIYVQFVVEAPTAESVHVVGDFTEWQPTIALEDADGDGTWSGRVALRPGVHEYMFVIDGSDWVTDPNAAGYQDDGFGQRNAVVAVSGLNGT
jgi:hypothetical protein